MDDRAASSSSCYASFQNTARCPDEISTACHEASVARASMEVMDGKEVLAHQEERL